MYKRILKKDLLRKKTMNIILLIFITLSAMFMASSGNNLISVMSATDRYIEKAGVKDYIIMSMSDMENDDKIESFLNNSENVEDWFVDRLIYISPDKIMRENQQKLISGSDNAMFFDIVTTKQQNFFDDKNNQITEIPKGEVYVSQKYLNYVKLKSGDKILCEIGNMKKEFVIAGSVKDATMGSTMMGATRILINDDDFNEIAKLPDNSFALMYSIDASDLDKFTIEANKGNFNRIVDITIPLVKLTYIMDTILALMLFIVSICLIIISIVVLRFTVSFTVSEEFREIGIMKAIGITPGKIRGLYIVKYLVISSVGAVLGYVLSIPVSRYLISQVSTNIVIEKTYSADIAGIAAVMLMIGIIMLFCYQSTKIVKKYSPIDAIRNGTTGERFKKKGLIRMSKSPFRAVVFMAINDILSSFRRFATMTAVFTLGIIVIIIPLNTINTLKSDNLLYWFGLAPCDYFISNESMIFQAVNTERGEIEKAVSKTKERLKNAGIDAEVFWQVMLKSRIAYEGNTLNISLHQYTGTTLEKNAFIEGSAPKNANEIAVAHLTADTLGIKVGDRVKLMIGDMEDSFIVTAIFQSMMDQGMGALISEKYMLDYKNSTGALAMQLLINNGEKDIERIKEIFSESIVQKPEEYINGLIGGISDMIRGPQIAITVIVILVNILVAVLMAKSFITKEKSEIGLLKSIGFSNKAVISWQMTRVGIILIISMILGIILSEPLGQLTSGAVFKMMGASSIEFDVNYLEVYILYPLIIFIGTMAASFLAILSVRKINPRDTGNIE